MSTPVKVSACGSIVRLDFGSGFITMGLCDSITPWPQTKAINDLPTLDCETSAEVGREQQSTLIFTQYWDPQDVDQALVVTNFEEALTDNSKKDVPVQYTTASYTTTGGASSSVTHEATCQVAEVAPEELTPDGFYKRQVTVVCKSSITKTVTPDV